MKKLFFLFLISFLTTCVLQTNAQVKLGLQAGVNLGDVSLDPEPAGYETGIRTALLVGAIVNYNFSPMLGLQLEPAYVQKGASADITATEDGSNIKAEATYSANYVDIPLLFKVTFGNEQIKTFLLAGASVAVLVGDVKLIIDKAVVNGQNVTNMVTSEQKEQIQKAKSTDFILNFGDGVIIPAGEIDIFIEGQYNIGLTNVNDEPNDNTEIKTKGIQVKAGALISL